MGGFPSCKIIIVLSQLCKSCILTRLLGLYGLNRRKGGIIQVHCTVSGLFPTAPDNAVKVVIAEVVVVCIPINGISRIVCALNCLNSSLQRINGSRALVTFAVVLDDGLTVLGHLLAAVKLINSLFKGIISSLELCKIRSIGKLCYHTGSLCEESRLEKCILVVCPKSIYVRTSSILCSVSVGVDSAVHKSGKLVVVESDETGRAVPCRFISGESSLSTDYETVLESVVRTDGERIDSLNTCLELPKVDPGGLIIVLVDENTVRHVVRIRLIHRIFKIIIRRLEVRGQIAYFV